MNNTDTKKIVVMTGATSGIGANAVELIAAQPNMRIIIGARGAHSEPEGAEVIPLDLASLANVRVFADEVKQRLGGAHIDILVLNAGIQPMDTTQRTVDGFETTFAVNHLAHYLLARLLVPCRLTAVGWFLPRVIRMTRLWVLAGLRRLSRRSLRIPASARNLVRILHRSSVFF